MKCARPLAMFLCMFLCLPLLLAALFAADEKKSEKKPNKPELLEALKRQIRGQTKIKGERIDVVYDFKNTDQAQDFRSASQGYSMGSIAKLSESNLFGRVECEPGKLLIPKDKAIYWALPLKRIDALQLSIAGAKELEIVIGDAGATTVVNISDYSSIHVGSDSSNVIQLFGAHAFRMDPKKTYRVELNLEGKNAVVKIDGKKLMEEEIPRGYEAAGGVRFEARGVADAYVSSFALRGAIREDAGLVAANRGRGQEKLPPVWEQSFRAEGERFEVESAVSQEDADLWKRLLEAQLKAILKQYEPPAGMTFPKKKFYVFDNAEALAAYREGLETLRLPDGDYAIATAAGAKPGDTEWRWDTLRMTAYDHFVRLYPSAPAWWVYGHMNYFAAYTQLDQETISFGRVDLELAKQAKKYLESQQATPLSSLLRTWTSTKYDASAAAVCWVWVHFLRESEGGANSGLLQAFHEAMKSGRDATEALDEVLPIARFNELYPNFLTYLEKLG